jgi:PAS domain S-box-containing protein
MSTPLSRRQPARDAAGIGFEALQALRKSEERFRLAAQAGRMFAYEWDAASGVAMLSGECVQILGVDEGTHLNGKQLLCKVHPDDRERLSAALAGLSPENPCVQISHRVVHPDRGVIWVETSSRALFDKAGKTLRISGMVADITARKLAEIELALANDRLNLAMKSATSVVWDWDVESGRDSWFGDLQTIFGISSSTYAGHVEDFRRRVHPEDRERVWKAVKDAMQNQKAYTAEFRIVRPDGTLRWVAAQGKFYYFPDGKPERMLGMAVDITERKGAEEALRESEERLRLAAQAGRMYAYEWDRASDVIRRSADFAHILGMTSEPTVTTCRQMLTTVHPDDKANVIAATEGCTPENPKCRIKYRILRPDGSVVWLEKNAHAFFDRNGAMVRMIGMIADITEQKLAEEALSGLSRKLIEAQETERARIARDLHDDIGQRLALLSVTLEGMRHVAPDSKNEISNRVDELRKQILDISASVHALSHQLHSSQLRHLGIVNAIRGFCMELSEQQNVSIDFVCIDVPETIPQDISLCLFRVLQEALHNAVKYSSVSHFGVELCGTSDAVHLTVRDSGIGFNPEAAMKGHGLGLTSMRERLKLVDGQFSIESQPMRGTAIYAFVPLNSERASARALGAVG